VIGGNGQIWDARSEKPLAPPIQLQAFVNAVAFSPDGQTLATGTKNTLEANGTAQIWDARSGKPLTPPIQLQAPVNSVAFSPDGRALATGGGSMLGQNGTVQIWDARSGKLLAPPIQTQAIVSALAFSLDGQTLAIGTWKKNGTVQIRDARSGKPLSPPIQTHDAVSAVAFSLDGRALFVVTHLWLNTYSWDGKNAIPQSSQLLHGFWEGGFHFPLGCERCLEVALADTGNSFHLETLNLDQPNDPPLEGDPKELLKKWQERLGLTFDEEMRPVPR
jgi:WD40 repeat protein